MKAITDYILLVSVFLLVASCARDTSATNETTTHEHQTSLSFPDAKEFLSGWSRQNSLVIMIQSDPVTLHPCGELNLTAQMIENLTHGFLMVADQQQAGVVPSLVKSLPQVSPDGLQYTYELLSEAQWDDGSPLTADDVIFTLKANKCPLTNNSTLKSYVENLKTIIADSVNPKKFTMVMKSPYVSNESFVTGIAIMSRKFFDPKNILSQYTFAEFDDPEWKSDQHEDLTNWSVEFNNVKYATDPKYFFGAGPYKVTSWDHGNSVTLQRKANHWSSRLNDENIYLHSYPDQIICKVVRDETAQILEFKSQTADVSNILSNKALIELQKDSSFNRNYNSAFIESYGMNFITLNMRPDGVTRKKIFDDVRVRQAFALLTPVDQIINVVTMGKAIRWPSMVSPLRPEFNKDLSLLPYDVAKAKKLLDEAGWKDSDGDGVRDKIVSGEKIPLQVAFTYVNQSNTTKDIANMMVESANQAGVKIIPNPVDGPLLQANAKSHDYDLLLAGWSTSALQEDYTQLWHTSSWANKSSNYSGFGNAASDALIDSIKYTLNDSLRHEMSKRLQKMVYDEQPYIFLYSTYKKIAIHKRWGNQIMTAEAPNLILNNLRLLAPQGSAVLKTNGN
ncbi:MAG TPA: ABC transporter substrate-binding protein [Chitinophagales bacterium]|nr:ABC transporter substrate-binding protein [Chitinophagales bacterium]